MTLWLVRHAQPLVAPGVCYGATDVPADPAATLEAASALAEVLPLGLPLVSSPLRRCTQLAEALQTLRPDLAGSTDARLAEMDFGCWEGWRWDAIDRAEIERWTQAFASHRFGGRESVQALMDRVADARRDTAALAGGDGSGRGDSNSDSSGSNGAVWITHAGVIRAARLLARGIGSIDQAHQWPREAIGFGQWQRQAL